MRITIEKAAPSDAAAIIAYLKQVGGETDNLTFGAEGLPVTVEAEKAYIAQLENSGDGLMLLAKENGKIIGSATVSRLPRRMRHRGDVGISVAKEYWNRGIGSRLLGKAIAFAKEKGLAFLELQVRSDNLRAIRLYEKHGFQKICTYPAFFRIGEQLIDFDFMYLPLEERKLPIALRALSADDAAAMLEILADRQVNQTYMLPDFERKEDALPLFRRLMTLSRDDAHFVRGIFADDTLVGFLNDVEIQNGVIELGYVIHPNHWGRGCATAALKAAIQDLFALGFREVQCGAFTENPASIRVMEKAGMTLLPKTEDIEYRGSVHLCVYYGICAE